MFLRLADECKLLLSRTVFLYLELVFLFFKCGTWGFFHPDNSEASHVVLPFPTDLWPSSLISVKFHMEKCEEVLQIVWMHTWQEERVPLMSAAVWAHSLLIAGRAIEKWCSAGHVLQAEAGREGNCRQKSIWNSSPNSSFYVTVLVHSFVGKQVSFL